LAIPEGSRIGGFEVLAPLGAGGMGEVYRARDSKLGREVAIKVLPEDVAKHPERVARFEREARLLAAVNHPNIAAIYGLEEQSGALFLVMELVPGQTIDEMLVRGPLAVGQALEIARQIASALDAAHEKGIVHRDLKPSNVKVTPGGLVKVLDFGLAKALASEDSDAHMSKSPTLPADNVTAQGIVMGTVAYMSPEQARGRLVDKRTDIWAFGCVLFEMLTGRPAFGGETVTDSLASIVTRDPDWERLPPETPEPIRALLDRCLQKDAAQRLRDIGDARIEIQAVQTEASGSAPRSAFLKKRRRRMPWRALIAAAGIVTAVAAGVAFWNRPAKPIPASIPERKYVAVLPFRDLSGSEDGKLVGEGMVDTVSARLGDRSGVQVISSLSTIEAAARESDPFRAARSLGANLVLRGSVQRSGDRVRITYTVWNVENQAQVAGGTLDGSAADLFDLQDQLVAQVSSALSLPASRRARPPSSGLETASQQERYLRAIGHLQHYNTPASVDAAVDLLKTLAVEVPASPIVQAALGRADLEKFSLTHDPEWITRAAAACGKAQEASPDFPEVEITVGRLRTLGGKPKEAIAAFRAALAKDPDSFEALLGLAGAYDASGNFTDAQSTYRQAIDLQPSYFGGYSKLAGFYFGHGKYREASRMFRRVTELSPDNAIAWSNLGGTYQLAGEFDQALEAYHRSLDLEPTGFAYSNVGTAEFYLGHYQKAAEAFERAVKLMPDLYRIWANLGDADRWAPGLRAGSESAYEKAIALCRRELALNSSDALVRAVLASSLAKIGKLGDAETEIEIAVQGGTENPDVEYHAAVVAAIGHKNAEATRWIRRAIAAGYPSVLIGRDPEFRELRNEKGFQDAVGAKGRADL
jgi:serine/threonine protein kinase/tetratricopeptide (TPR) repeat protein